MIGDDGTQYGIVSRTEALRIAEDAGLDLVEVSPDSNPPVVKVVNWGKYNYQKTKQLQKNKRQTKNLEVKQMRVGLKISEHDLGVKMAKVEQFLKAGHKVKIAVVYRGRELAHKDIGYKLADKVIAHFGETVAVDQNPQFAGRQLTFMIRNTNAKVKNP